MSRWIDADALIKSIKYTGDLGGYIGAAVYHIKQVAIKYIDEAPSIDIVRCGECRWATETRMKSIEGDVIYLKTCPSRTEVIDDDDFCSYGERKESE